MDLFAELETKMPEIYHYRHKHGARAVVAASIGLPGNPAEWTFESTEKVDPNPAPGSEAARWLKEIDRVGHCIERSVAQDDGVPPQDATSHADSGDLKGFDLVPAHCRRKGQDGPII